MRPEALVRNLLWMLRGFQLVLQPPDRAEFGIASKNEAHDFRCAIAAGDLGAPRLHIPFRFEAAILSRMRSPMTSRSNCAKDSSTLRVKRLIEVVVLNCCVTETKDAPLASRISTILAKSASERVSRSIL